MHFENLYKFLEIDEKKEDKESSGSEQKNEDISIYNELIWKKERMPIEWKEAQITPIYERSA